MSNWSLRVGTATLAIALIQTASAQEPPEPAPAPRARIAPPITTTSLQALALRHIGPCLTPGASATSRLILAIAVPGMSRWPRVGCGRPRIAA